MSNRPSEEWPGVQTANITPTIIVLDLTEEVLDCVKADGSSYLLKLNWIFI